MSRKPPNNPQKKPGKAKPATARKAVAVEAVFAAYPPALRRRLQAVRRLILKTAADAQGVGALTETLKWGQPSYLAEASGSGTTIRIDRIKGDDRRYAVYFHCQTNLVETFRALYPDAFEYGGNRAILLDAASDVDEAALRHCIGLALTYRLRKAASR